MAGETCCITNLITTVTVSCILVLKGGGLLPELSRFTAPLWSGPTVPTGVMMVARATTFVVGRFTTCAETPRLRHVE